AKRQVTLAPFLCQPAQPLSRRTPDKITARVDHLPPEPSGPAKGHVRRCGRRISLEFAQRTRDRPQPLEPRELAAAFRWPANAGAREEGFFVSSPFGSEASVLCMTFFLLQRMAGTRGLGARSETGSVADRRGRNECFQFVVHEDTECYR